MRIGWLRTALVIFGIALTVVPPASRSLQGLSAIPVQEPAASPPGKGRSGSLARANAQLPLAFEPNRGQFAGEVRFLARTGADTVFLTDDEAVVVMREATVFRMKFLGTAAGVSAVGAVRLPGTVNYFLGRDPARWRTGIPTFARVIYQGMYPGTDLVFRGEGRRLRYDLILAPGASPADISVAFSGITRLKIDRRGDLVLSLPGGEIRQSRPFIYQEVSGVRLAVRGGYILRGENQVGFEVEAYDPTRPLIIDPTLVYSTYLGGSGNDEGHDIAVDGAGNVYLTGFTTSANFPVAGALQPLSGLYDAFITKLNPEGTALIYSTYLGGSGRERAHGLAVDASGSAYVTGRSDSADFPTTPGAFDQSFNGNVDAFVTKLNASGSALVYSTYLGGAGFENDEDFDALARRNGDIAVDVSGNAYVTGATTSTNFPTLNPFQAANAGFNDAFVTKVNAQGSALVWSTYLGGSDHDRAQGVAVDGSGNVYVSGDALSPNFPTTPGSFRTARPGGFNDVFVTKLAAAGNALAYSTFLGGTGSENLFLAGIRIAVDGGGSAYAVGDTSSFDYPTTPGALQPTKAGDIDAFVTKLNPSGSALTYSTYLGGLDDEFAAAISVDGTGAAYLAGSTTSGGTFPQVGAAQICFGNFEAFVAKLNSQGSALIFSTCLGGTARNERGFGVAVDALGAAYVTGWTNSTNFPVTPGAFQITFAGGATDAFVAKFGGATGGGSCVGTGTFRLAGRIRTSAGVAVSGVTVTLSGSNGCGNATATASRGDYSFLNLANGVYTVTPSKAGCTFTPSSRTITISGANSTANFTATCS